MAAKVGEAKSTQKVQGGRAPNKPGKGVAMINKAVSQDKGIKKDIYADK